MVQGINQVEIVLAMKILILPMFFEAFQNSQNRHDANPSVVKTIVEKMLDPFKKLSAKYSEPLSIEIL